MKKSTVRTIYDVDIVKEGDYVRMRIPWKWLFAEHGEDTDRNTGRGWIWEYECGAYS